MAKKKMAPAAAAARAAAQDTHPAVVAAAAADPEDSAHVVDPERKTRSLSPYNHFMKINVTKLKQENPGIPHKDAFRRAALAWASAPENPKNAVSPLLQQHLPTDLHHHHQHQPNHVDEELQLQQPELPGIMTTSTATTATTSTTTTVKKGKGTRKLAKPKTKASDPVADTTAAAAT